MIRIVKKALKYAVSESENPKEIKKNMEEYFAAAGYDRRYKFKWCAVSTNPKYTLSGIFEYFGQRYYFNRLSGELELERI